MSNFKVIDNYVGSRDEKFFKASLFESERLLLGLNCLETGQSQPLHAHADQDKFYFVVEGEGEFEVGETRRTVPAGTAVWAPEGVEHGVTNRGERRLVLLVGIAPAPTPAA